MKAIAQAAFLISIVVGAFTYTLATKDTCSVSQNGTYNISQCTK